MNQIIYHTMEPFSSNQTFESNYLWNNHEPLEYLVYTLLPIHTIHPHYHISAWSDICLVLVLDMLIALVR